ncbi:MAG: hypothetical protein MZV70_10605 [Desulfobacterales bacterium]|nr:hypothetical protein [Desulfobacterales bacterium]
MLGKHSGRHALRAHLKDLGYDLSDDELEPGVRQVQGAGRQEEARGATRTWRPS